jgi:methylated-DNA-[protein]-cysteine S-methyltransferase
MESEFALFETPIGPCGIAWGGRGIAGIQLPEADAAGTRARLLRRFPKATEAPPPPAVADAVQGIITLLSGRGDDLSTVEIDLGRVPEFHRRVYEVTRSIPPGETLTYGEVAARLGEPGAARAVGRALGRNPFPIVVPCHRIVAAGGRTGGFSARGGVLTKVRLLEIEGAGQPRLPF